MQQKLKSATFEKIIQANLTSSELNFIVYLSHFQDDTGTIIGVYYKDICEAIKISHQTFYDVLRSLSEKGIISYKKKNYNDWDITILNNDFSYENALKEGYIKMGFDMFHDPGFYKLKVHEKLLAIHIMRASAGGDRSYCIGVQNFYDKFKETFGVTKRVLQGYIKSLRKFFSIGIKEGKIWVTVLKWAKNSSMTDKKAFSWHNAKVLFRRNRVKVSEDTKVFKGMMELVGQYLEQYKYKSAKYVEYVMSATRRSLQLRNAGIKSEYKWNREIIPQYVHYLLKEYLI